MKVALIYRKQRHDAFSIEELFRTIAGELRQSVDLFSYEVGERRHTVRDVIALRQLRADVYHITGDVNYFAPLLPRGASVLTVHDIGHFAVTLKGWRRAVYKWLWFTWPIRAAAAVTCVSTETRQQLARHFGLEDREVDLIENCHSALFRPVPREFGKTRPRILQVGTKPYKNVPRLVRALRGIACTLVLVGKLDAETLAALAETGVEYENKVNLTHSELALEYVSADLVTFPSVGEGFGVPIIEAQASGRPLVTSDVSPMREVAGAGACLVDPLSEHSIREGVLRVIADDTFRTSIVEAGLVNVQRYSPSAAAASYLQVYQRVVGASPLRAPLRTTGLS
jgi:glycosyltransferase involved in cell wall biosynthesis